MKKSSVVLILFAALLVVAPASSAGQSGSGPETLAPRVDPDITSGKAARQFRKARRKWLKRDIRDYRMTAHRVCYCAGPMKTQIRVRNRRPVRISDRPWYQPRTVPGMLRIIAKAIKGKAASLDVRYHRRLGFPRRASIDYIARVADDEMYYRINHFRIHRRPGGPKIWGGRN